MFIVKCTYNTDQHAQTTFTSQNNLILLLHYLLTKKTWLFINPTEKYQQMAQLHLSPIGQNCHRKYCSSKIDFFTLEKCTAFSCFPFNQWLSHRNKQQIYPLQDSCVLLVFLKYILAQTWSNDVKDWASSLCCSMSKLT